jgi:hypothetical protein
MGAPVSKLCTSQSQEGIKSMHTYESIAESRNVGVKTVRRWRAKAEKKAGTPLGHQPSHVQPLQFDDHERDLIVAEASDKPAVAEEVKSIVPEVFVGNHRQVLESPEIPQEFSLERFRGDRASIQRYGNSAPYVQAAHTIADALIGAMNQDLQAQGDCIDGDLSANAAIQEQLQRVEREGLKYEILSDVNATRQNEATHALGKSLQQLQSLQRPSSSPSAANSASESGASK